MKKKKNELYIAVDVTLEAQEEKQKKTEKKEYRPTSLLQFFYSLFTLPLHIRVTFFFSIAFFIHRIHRQIKRIIFSFASLRANDSAKYSDSCEFFTRICCK